MNDKPLDISSMYRLVNPIVEVLKSAYEVLIAPKEYLTHVAEWGSKKIDKLKLFILDRVKIMLNLSETDDNSEDTKMIDAYAEYIRELSLKGVYISICIYLCIPAYTHLHSYIYVYLCTYTNIFI